MNQLPKMIVVLGTNASGKSGLGVELARRYNGEIISADSRQVFAGLDLGSGKIRPAEMKGVPHHLLDVCQPGDFFSMADFQRLAYQSIEAIRARGRMPFLVGGTGLYVSAVTEGYLLSDAAPDLQRRAELDAMSTEALYALLQRTDPSIEIDSPNNRNRIIRKLEKRESGQSGADRKEKRYDSLRLGVTWDRATLAQRIDERLERRLRDGMIEEVEQLLQQGVSTDFLLKLGLEYRFIVRYLQHEFASLDEMCAQLAQAIRQFAKRQMTWFKRDPDIHWLSMEADPLAEACGYIDAFLSE